MAQVINVTGYGELSFPDNFTDEQISNAIKQGIDNGSLVKERPLSEREQLKMPRKEYGELLAKETEDKIVQDRMKIAVEESPGFSMSFPRLTQAQAEGYNWGDYTDGDPDWNKLGGAAFMDAVTYFPRALKGSTEALVGEAVDNESIQGSGVFAQSMSELDRPGVTVGDIMASTYPRSKGIEETPEEVRQERLGEPWWQAIPGEVSSDILTYIPGIGQAKWVKELGLAPRFGTIMAGEAGMEATSQVLDPTKEFDPWAVGGASVVGGAGEGLSDVATHLAKKGYGDKVGKELLEEGLIPWTGNPEAKLTSEIDKLKEVRFKEASAADEAAFKAYKNAEESASKLGVDEVELIENLAKKDLDIIKNIDNQVNYRISKDAGLIDKDAKIVRDWADSYLRKAEELAGNQNGLTILSETLFNDAAKGGTRGKAAQFVLDELENILPKSDSLKKLSELGNKNIRERDYSTISNIIQEGATSAPMIRTTEGLGQIMSAPLGREITKESVQQLLDSGLFGSPTQGSN